MKKDYRGSFEYNKWKFGVFIRDNYTCQCCGSDNNPEAHHILNYKTNEALRLDIKNGITLCKKCHNVYVKNSFHYLYGTENNNKEQLEEYINNKRNGLYNIPEKKFVDAYELDWVHEHKEIIRDNVYYLRSHEFEIELPYLHKMIESKINLLLLFISKSGKILDEKMQYKEKPLFIKTMDNDGFDNLICKNALELFVPMKLILKIEPTCLKEDQLNSVYEVIKTSVTSKSFSLYQIPEYGYLYLEPIEKEARKLIESTLEGMKWSKEYQLNTYNKTI